eukprot:scaffold2091_cov66-Skeletonema_marinoi.AAC.1
MSRPCPMAVREDFLKGSGYRCLIHETVFQNLSHQNSKTTAVALSISRAQLLYPSIYPTLPSYCQQDLRRVVLSSSSYITFQRIRLVYASFKNTMSSKDADLGEKLSAPPDFNGPTSKRHMTDILCTVLLWCMWIAMTGLGLYAMQQGDYRLILYPLDYDGNLCGTNKGQ